MISVWGESDCLTFIADALSRELGKRYLLPRPAYLAAAKTDTAAAELARLEHGSVGAAFIALLDGEVAAGRLNRVLGEHQPNDICLLGASDGARIGIIDNDHRVLVRTRRGTARWDGAPSAAWRLSYA